ncbi:MAG TPA: hypothetical protein VFK48_03495 [Usitatibacter sp.]|nr:hypothetical protein [Usitatibacter sp.]
MNLIARHYPRAPDALRAPEPRRPTVQDHDLPVLGIERNPRVRLDWDSMLAAGIQPALILGAERRWQGRR